MAWLNKTNPKIGLSKMTPEAIQALKKIILYFVTALAALILCGVILFLIWLYTPQITFFKETPKFKETQKVIETNLLALSVQRIDWYHKQAWDQLDKETRQSGALTSIGDDIVILVDQSLFHFDLVSQKITSMDNIVLPPNHHKKARAYFESQDPNARTREMRYHDVLAIEKGDKVFLLINYSFWNERKKCVTLRLAQSIVSRNTDPRFWAINIDDWKVIFETKPCLKDGGGVFIGNQGGGRMAASPKKDKIFITIGDYEIYKYTLRRLKKDNRENEAGDYGKIFEITLHNGKKSLISSGHRNPQGIIFDEKGRLWSVEHGPDGGDELNLIERGGHYGWPFASYGTDYGSYFFWDKDIAGRHDSHQKPIFAFVPSIGISNITTAKNFDPSWDGDLLISSLRKKSIYRVRIIDKRVILTEKIFLDMRIRYLHNHNNGTLLALGGSRKAPKFFSLFIINALPKTDGFELDIEINQPDIAKQAIQTWHQCLTCHSIAENQSADQIANARAPNLRGVVGQRIGSTDWQGYSQALSSSFLLWNEDRLERFITNPQAVFEDSPCPKC